MGDGGYEEYLMHQEYETKNSGKRHDFDSGMRRDDQSGKPRFDLLIPENVPYEETFLYRWASLMARGEKLYGERNWEKANTPQELARFKASAFRHFMQWYSGEDDEDHAVACAFNIQGAEYLKRKLASGE